MRSPTLGVLGGMGPAAGSEFFRQFTARWPARRDQDHPRVVLLSEPSIPDRSAALTGGGEDPTPQIRIALEELSAWGVDLLAVPCNTAFAFIEGIVGSLPVPVVNTVEVAVRAASRAYPEGAWLMATEGCVSAGLFQRCAAWHEYPLFLPEADAQRQLQEIVRLTKAGSLDDACELFMRSAERLAGIRRLPFVLGCTELSLVWTATGRRVSAVDALEALANVCVASLLAVSRS